MKKDMYIQCKEKCCSTCLHYQDDNYNKYCGKCKYEKQYYKKVFK